MDDQNQNDMTIDPNANTVQWKSPVEIAMTAHLVNPVIGDPALDEATQHGEAQETPYSCAIRAQKIILDEFTGTNHPESDLVHQAVLNHIFDPDSGTSLEDVGKLLELNGIQCEQYPHGNIYNLASELGQGHKVIIAVESADLWQQPSEVVQGHADHAVIVSGIDTSDPDNTKVIVCDPATGHTTSYPMDQFMEAWSQSNCFMVATTSPPPEERHLDTMAHFDYAEGHVTSVNGVSYYEFLHWVSQLDGSGTSPVPFPMPGHDDGSGLDHSCLIDPHQFDALGHESSQGLSHPLSVIGQEHEHSPLHSEMDHHSGLGDVDSHDSTLTHEADQGTDPNHHGISDDLNIDPGGHFNT